MNHAAGGATWVQIVDRWDLLEFDFTQVLRVDLEREFRQRSFRWFRVHMAGLLGNPSSLIHNYFREADDG